MSGFKCLALKELTEQQVRYISNAKRQQQIANAQKLIEEIDGSREYPYEYVCFKLTGYRPENSSAGLFTGADLKHDLALFVNKLERSLPPTPIELFAEPMLTLEEVSHRFNVSIKTVSRWRLQGLTSRRVLRDGRRQLGFPLSAVESFANAHSQQVERGARFSHLTDAEKADIVRTARALAADGVSLTNISKRIAKQIGRSTEAVRYTIKNFDRDHPDSAVFPHGSGPLDQADKEKIATASQEGHAMKTIAKTNYRSRSRIYDVLNESRANRLLSEPIDYIYSSEFDDPTKRDEILAPMPNQDDFFGKIEAMKAPKDVEPHMAYLYERPLLSREQEAHLFRKMNFLKHEAHKLQEKINPSRPRMQEVKELERVQHEAMHIRDLLIECNQRLVHNLATKHLQVGQNLDELKSDANLSIMRAVEKFDYSRGFKFSTYATWAVMKNFARSIPDENTRKQRYMTGHDDLFDGKADIRTDENEVVAAADAAMAKVNRLLDYLDPRTREVIRMRTGLDGTEEMTLEQIGQHFGITKERVRQINVRGMKQLRERALREGVELS